MAIEIKKSHKGLFTKKAKEHGMSVQAYAKYVLSHKDNQDSRTVKQANFAKNFAEFGTNNLGYNDTFNLGNLAAVLTTLVANKANDISGLKSENNQYLKSIQPQVIQNKNSNGLNNTPAYFKNGGGVDNNLLNEWNNFIDFVGQKGYKGSADLDVKDKKLGQSLFDEYKKINPNSPLSYDAVLPIQQVIQQYRNQSIQNFKDGKAKLNGDAGTNYEHFMEGLSQPDGWFGSKTSSWKFPKEYLKTYNADHQLESTQELGLAKMKNGGDVSKEKAKEILRDGTAQGHKLTAKQKRYFGWIAGGKKAKYGIDNAPVVNAENGEVFQATDGNIYDINGEDRHENGGVDLTDVQRVLENTSTYRSDKASQALKLTPDMVAQLGGIDEKPKRALSHAQAAKFLTKKLNKQVGDFERNLNKNTDVLKDTPDNLYAKNSLEFNTINLQSLPTEGDIFDKLFAHQEMIKDIHGIENGKKMKYGGHKYTIAATGYDDTTPYSGGKTKKGRTTPTGKDNAFQFDINDYNRLWKYRTGIDANTFPDNQSFQKSTYAYLLDRNPQAIRDMWSSYGNTDFGLQNKIGEGYDFNNLTDEQLQNLGGAYADNLLGVRSLTPDYQPQNVTKVPRADYQLPPIPNPDGSPDININQPAPPTVTKTTTKRDSRFFEPLRWFDIAAPLLSYLDSSRIPNKYNPINLNEVRLKQLNPEAALQRGQQDFNAVLGELPNTGIGNANAANVFSQKYAADNQVIANYDNQNAQIKNQETMYNAGVRDKQSLANAQSRDTFEQKVLASREAQRQQKLTSLDDLFTRVALNHKLNREGDLMMQLYPNFDQYARYNGNQRYFTPNSGANAGSLDQKLIQLGVNPKDLTQAQKLQYLRMQMPKKK